MTRQNTLHERALKTSFYEAIDENPQMAATVAEVRTRLVCGGFYSLDIVNAAFQKWERDLEITMIDAFGFAQIWTHYLNGDIAYCSVPMPHGPERDSAIELNQVALDQLPEGFHAKYTPERGGGADDDGLFTIKDGIGLHRTFLEGDRERDELWFFKGDHTIALEVGTTSVSKTLYHLRCGRGVARWPYGYDKIIVLAGVKTRALDLAAAGHREKAEGSK